MGINNYIFIRLKGYYMWLKAISYAALFSVSSLVFADYATKKDLQVALKKANAGNPESMLLVSGYYDMGGYGFDENQKEKFRWLNKAANANYNPAIYEYVTYYYNNNDQANALKWLERGVANNDYRSTYDLAMSYCNGVGVKQDLVKCASLLQKVANTKVTSELHTFDYWAVVESSVYLSTLYARGLGVKKDLNKSNQTFDNLINFLISQDPTISTGDSSFDNISSAILQIGDNYNRPDSNSWGGYKYNPTQAKFFYELGIYLGKNKTFHWDTSVFHERIAALSGKK